MALDGAVTLAVSSAVVAETWAALRRFGRVGHEGFVLWLGRVDGQVAFVSRALVPPQDSIRSEDGVGYFVTSDTLFSVNRTLHTTGLRLIAQVHSHPREAYHSTTDDAYAVVTAEGGFSIVVPNFAAGMPDPLECAVYRLRGGVWTGLTRREVGKALLWGSE